MHRLKEILENRETYYVNATDTVRDAVRVMCEKRVGAILVRAGEELVGVFSERDALHRVLNKDRNPGEVLVEEVMSRNPLHIHMNDSIEMAKALMHMNKCRHLLAVSEGEIMGLVSMRDILERELGESSELISELNDKYYEKAYRPKWRISSNRVIVESYVPQ
mgnify:CR=1 FL=1